MEIKYSKYNKQNPVSISALTEYLFNDNIVINLKGTLDTNTEVINKYEIDCGYSRIFDETYIFKKYSDAVSFLNCETDKSLFCVLFNESLNDDTRYHPSITEYKLLDDKITFKINTEFEIECTESSLVTNADFTYSEDIEVTIMAQNILFFDDLLRPKLKPSIKQLKLKNLKINKDVLEFNDYANKYSKNKFHRIPIIQDGIEQIKQLFDIVSTDILVSFTGESGSCHESTEYAHNEIYRFEKFSTMKKFLEVTVRNDGFFFIFDSVNSYGITKIISETEGQISVRIDNDMDQWSDNLILDFYYQDESVGKKISKYIEKQVEMSKSS